MYIYLSIIERERARKILFVRLPCNPQDEILAQSENGLNAAAWQRDNGRRELRLDAIYFGSDMRR